MTTDIPVKKSLGQNWLVNEGVLDRMVGAAELTENDTVIEVGPGKGVLTKRLARHARRVIVIEKDPRLIDSLKTHFADTPHVEIVAGDILEIDPGTWELAAGAWKLVANLPYYITSHFLRTILEEWSPPKTLILMVQYEVAKRMQARPPSMNLLALSVQLFADVSQIMRVSRGSFRPVPDVDSAVIKISPHAQSPQRRQEADRILSLAKKAFGQKRKQLTATLPAKALADAGIAAQARPQELSIDDWRRLVQHVS